MPPHLNGAARETLDRALDLLRIRLLTDAAHRTAPPRPDHPGRPGTAA